MTIKQELKAAPMSKVKGNNEEVIESFWRYKPDETLIRRIIDSRKCHLAEFAGLSKEKIEYVLSNAGRLFQEEWFERKSKRGMQNIKGFYEETGNYIFDLAASDVSGSMWRLEYLAKILGRHVAALSKGGKKRPLFLDYGAGLGEVGLYFASCCKVVSLDVKGRTQDFARFRADKLGFDLRFVNSMDGLENLDIISAQDVLEHMEDPMGALAGMILSLRPGGLLVTSGMWFNPTVISHIAENEKYKDSWLKDLDRMGMDLCEVFQGDNWQVAVFSKAKIVDADAVEAVLNVRKVLIKAEGLLSVGRYDRAGVLLTDLLKKGNATAEVYNNLGVLAFMKGDSNTARKHLLKADSLEPKNGETMMNLGDAESSAHNLDAALHWYKLCLLTDESSYGPEARQKIEQLLPERARLGQRRMLLVLDEFPRSQIGKLVKGLETGLKDVKPNLLLLDSKIASRAAKYKALESVINEPDERFYEYLFFGYPSKRAKKLYQGTLTGWCGAVGTVKSGKQEDVVQANLRVLNFLGEPGKPGLKGAGYAKPVTTRSRVGFVSLWYPRGQAYVTRHLRAALSGTFDTFVLARNGGKAGEKLFCTTGEWAVPNLEIWPEYKIPSYRMRQWVRAKELDVVMFNEEYDLGLVWAARDAGAKAIGYYVWELFDPRMAAVVSRAFNRVLCPTRASFERFKEIGVHNAVYLPWAVMEEDFLADEAGLEQRNNSLENGRMRFFHPAGLGGLHARRATSRVIEAFKRAGIGRAELIVHSQQGSGVEEHGNIRITRGTIGRRALADLYKSCHVAVLPSKWEGLGLTFLESLAAGLPIITVDAPPMNEFVRDHENGLLCPVKEWREYRGIHVKGAEAGVHDLALAMKELVSNTGMWLSLSRQATWDAENRWNREKFEQKLRQIVNNSLEDEKLSPSGKAALLKPGADGIKHGRVSIAVSTGSRLTLACKDYSGMSLEQGDDGALLLTDGNKKEPFTVHLVSARRSNHPWGMGNEVFRALEKMGARVLDTDFRLERAELPDLFRQEAHLVLVIKGDGIDPALISRQKGRTVLWYQDDVFTAPHAAPQVKFNGWSFDKVYSFDDRALDRFRELGARNVSFLPLAMSPAVHRKMFLEKKHDVCFVGNVYQNRRELLDRLSQRFDLVVTRAFMDDMVKLYNQSRIVLNLGLGRTGIQQRVFEALGCGSFLLTNEIPEESRLFEHRKHLVYFNEETIEDEIAYYLDHAHEREEIALAGYRKAHTYHTFEARLHSIVRDLALDFETRDEHEKDGHKKIDSISINAGSTKLTEPQAVGTSSISNQDAFMVLGMKRSGHHAILNWICGQYEKPIVHMNDCLFGEGGELAPNRKQMYPINYHNGANAQTSAKIYSMEDLDIWGTIDSRLKRIMDDFLKAGRLVLVVRDPYNQFASDIKGSRRSANNYEQLRKFYPVEEKVRLWKAYAKEALGSGVFDPNKLIIVVYNRWFKERDYRRELALKVGLQFSDAGFNKISLHGGGSSFDGVNVRDTSKMDVLNRWKYYAGYEFFRKLFDPEMVRLAAELFDMENPMDMPACPEIQRKVFNL
ncbi:MAG: glycosyltransferase [Deltaproteobacteria bacterium]|nr:glycosyltransferase [Deltaproteobacteria bacterium]